MLTADRQARIPDHVLEEIRERVDLIDLVGEHTSLRKRGREYVGLCPFHSERSPSFGVNVAKGVYLCRGCQAKGDAFDFVRQVESVDFAGAVERLAGRLGIEHDVIRGGTVARPTKPREVTIKRLLETRVPDRTWLAFYESGGTYAEGLGIHRSPINDARSWITARSRLALQEGDILTLGRLLEAFDGEWPEGHRAVWLQIVVESHARDAWWRGDVESVARAVDVLGELDRPVTA